ncbi:hypothetical protein ACSTJ6_23505, partial [Vibrio parahaemolyticus]
WYVFIREPKPFRVKSSMWGSYEVGSRSNDVDTLVNEYAAPRVPFFAGPQLMPANYESEFAGVQTNNLSNQDWNTLYSRMSA